MALRIIKRILCSIALLGWIIAPVQAKSKEPAPNPAAILFVLNKSEGTASALDPESGQELYKLTVGDGPHEAAASPDGRTVVVTNYGSMTSGNTLSVIDVNQKAVVKTITLQNYHRPHGIQFLPDGRRVVVTAEKEKVLLVVNLDSGQVEKAIPTQQEGSHMVALSPEGRRAYVSNLDSGSMTVINLKDGRPETIVSTAEGAEGIAYISLRGEIWVTNRGANSVSVIPEEKLEVKKNIFVSEFPIRAVVMPDQRFVLVSAAKSDEVFVLDAVGRKVVRSVKLPKGSFPIGIVVSPDGQKIYVANTEGDSISVIDSKSWKIVQTFKTGQGPDGMAWAVGK